MVKVKLCDEVSSGIAVRVPCASANRITPCLGCLGWLAQSQWIAVVAVIALDAVWVRGGSSESAFDGFCREVRLKYLK